MKTSYHTKSSLFLTEIVINIFFFFLLLSFSMQFFAMANTRKIKNQDLENAVLNCENAAEIFESGDGSLHSFLELSQADSFKIKSDSSESVTLYYDGNGNPCDRANTIYEMIITIEESDFAAAHPGYVSAQIDYRKVDGDSIFSITCCHYTPLTADLAEGGDGNVP